MQQRRAPRPLPLFLELVRLASQRDPELAAAALEGLSRYELAERSSVSRERPALLRVKGASLRDCGGSGAPAILIPSLINPPRVLDLDEEVSLASAVAGMGRHALLLDWGPADERSDLDIAGHVAGLLLPLLDQIDGPPDLIGYCLGGTMAIAAANLAPVARVATIAAPWRFSAYPPDARESLRRLWAGAEPAARQLGALPMEVLQGAFWSLDPLRTVAKFAKFASHPEGSELARRFIALEDWANEGEPLPYPAASELIEKLFGKDQPGRGSWLVGGRIATDSLTCPTLHITASHDRITPEATAAAGATVPMEAGHVGMVVGSARAGLHRALRGFLSG